MLIRAIVENQIKMLNTAAKQSPGKEANTFMLITKEERKYGGSRENQGEERAVGQQSQQVRVTERRSYERSNERT